MACSKIRGFPPRPYRLRVCLGLGGYELPFMAAAFLAGCGSSFSVTPDDAAGDGAADGAARDAPTSDRRSGPADAHDARDAGTGWCASQRVTFCEDFDEQPSVASFLGSWNTFQQIKGAFSFDMSAPPSPPNALRASGMDGAQLLVVKTFEPLSHQPSSLRLEFDLRINSAGKVGVASAAGFAAIAFGNSVEDGYVALAIGNDFGPQLAGVWAVSTASPTADAGPFGVKASTGPFPTPGNWAGRYAIEVEFTSDGGACLQAFNGPTALLTPCLPLPLSLAKPSTVSIALGDYAGGFDATGNVDIEFDNVTYDVSM